MRHRRGGCTTFKEVLGPVGFVFFLTSCHQEIHQIRSKQPLPEKIELPQLNQVVSDFDLLDSKGTSFRLSDFRGNFIFLNLWATWCAPCVQELPMMEALNQRFKAKNFTMLAVSVDRSWKDIETFFNSLSGRPTFLILLDPEKRVATGFGTSKFPETYVIDPRGRLVKKYVGAFNWRDPKILDEWEEFFEKTQ